MVILGRIEGARARDLGDYRLAKRLGAFDFLPRGDGRPALLFTENESNAAALWQQPNPSPFVKDAFHRYVVHGDTAAVNPAAHGTKAAAYYVLQVPAGESAVLRLRLSEGAAADEEASSPAV